MTQPISPDEGDALKAAEELVDVLKFSLRKTLAHCLNAREMGELQVALDKWNQAKISETRTDPPVAMDDRIQSLIEAAKDAEALLCDGVPDSPTVREVLNRLRAALSHKDMSRG